MLYLTTKNLTLFFFKSAPQKTSEKILKVHSTAFNNTDSCP